MPRQSWQRRRCARLLVLLFTGVCGAADAARPNILLILADDLGISDLSSFRLAEGTGPAITPTIDRLAREGLRFGRFYSDASCAATRAGLLTGRYPASLGFRPAGAGIDPGIVTLPERLREAGYTTRLIGKWHLGYDDREAWPLQQGFDRFYGFLNQFFLQRPSDNPAPGRPGYVDPAIREGAADDDPWFLAFWPYAPHDPPQPPGDIASRFEETPAGRHRALIATLDRQVERLLATLEESGQRDRTQIGRAHV